MLTLGPKNQRKLVKPQKLTEAGKTPKIEFNVNRYRHDVATGLF